MGALQAICSACFTPFRAAGLALRALGNPEGRRGWALVLLAGGGVAMTGYAFRALQIVKNVPSYAFYLGAGALALIAIVLTGFAGLLIRRRIAGSVLGSSFEISDEMQATAVVAATAAIAAKQATDAAPVQGGE